ncbi:type II toxin-antitoxin system RelE family toxin [Ornithinimicrobium avium]|uniref:type II toxin-antitoxin system RelE family toxin n=1 Tax=Ornithinimicrobium avium TaxID=2283195 RepID=UPI00192DBFD4|nr:type II toxin-antitoxin system RelE/ParE family toxin [Ornithinimicrobium avium]
MCSSAPRTYRARGDAGRAQRRRGAGRHPGGRRRLPASTPRTTSPSHPQRVGRWLRGQLEGIHSARRGTYRVLYRINEPAREVVVLRTEHRRDVDGRH